MNIFNIVSNIPIEELPSDSPRCPYCDSDQVSNFDKISTLGEINPSHTWETIKCKECKQFSQRETKLNNVWYTNDEIVLKGMPNSFEYYKYNCINCDGKGTVVRDYTELDGVTKTNTKITFVIDGKDVKQYRVFYNCDTCNHGGEVDQEYWNPKDNK